jgi:hypothetical protein
MAYMLHRIREDVFGSERGLLPTIWHLFVAPQRVALGFVRGDDLRYYGPVRYFIVVLALSLLLANSQPLFDGLIANQLVKEKLLLDKAAAQAFVADWNGLIYAPMLFVLALATRYFFRGSGHNYAEHLVIAAYGWSQMLLLGTLVFGLLAAFKALGLRGAILLPLLMVPPAYWLWYCQQVFAQPRGVGVVRAFTGLCAAAVAFLLVLGAGVQLVAVFVASD